MRLGWVGVRGRLGTVIEFELQKHDKGAILHFWSWLVLELALLGLGLI